MHRLCFIGFHLHKTYNLAQFFTSIVGRGIRHHTVILHNIYNTAAVKQRQLLHLHTGKSILKKEKYNKKSSQCELEGLNPFKIVHLPFRALTWLVGWQEGHPACKKRLVLVCWWWWCDWNFARPIAPVVTTTSIILCFNEHQLTQVQLENGC